MSMTTTAPDASAGPAPLELKDYFASVKDGTRKSSVTEKGELASRVGKKSNDAMDKDAFMTMLVTQLKYQDPMAPQDNQQLSAQMAQFSSLEVMQNVQKGVDGMGSSIAEMTKTQSAAANTSAGTSASNLIGKTVSIRQTEVSLTGPAPVALPVQGSSGASLVLRDLTGKVVRTVALSGSNADGSPILGPKGTGVVKLEPLDDTGAPLRGGFSASIEDALGKPAGNLYQKGTVEGVSYKDGIPCLAINNGSYKLSDLLTIMPGDAPEGAAAASEASASAGMGAASAASFLGKTVAVRNPEVVLSRGIPASLKVLGDSASRLVLTDAKGNVVKDIALSGRRADGSPILGTGGTGALDIDPTDADGLPLQGQFTASVVDASGRPSGTVFQQGKVSGLEFKDGTPLLSVGGNNYKLSELLALSAEPSNQGATP